MLEMSASAISGDDSAATWSQIPRRSTLAGAAHSSSLPARMPLIGFSKELFDLQWPPLTAVQGIQSFLNIAAEQPQLFDIVEKLPSDLVLRFVWKR